MSRTSNKSSLKINTHIPETRETTKGIPHPLASFPSFLSSFIFCFLAVSSKTLFRVRAFPLHSWLPNDFRKKSRAPVRERGEKDKIK